MKLKGDGRLYVVNIKPESWMPNDIYQGVLKLPSDEWVVAEVLFDF